MSAFNDIDITCARCGEEFRGTIWTAIHAGQDPELKDLLLGGEINMVMCPGCSDVSFHDHFLIYQDPAEELIAYVYPEHQAGERSELEAMMLTGFRQAQESVEPSARVSYEPLLFLGLESFIETLQEERSHIDQADVAEAVCREHHIPFHRLTPAEARRRQWPRLVPVAANAITDRKALRSGVQQLLDHDAALSDYAAFLAKITSESEKISTQG